MGELYYLRLASLFLSTLLFVKNLIPKGFRHRIPLISHCDIISAMKRSRVLHSLPRHPPHFQTSANWQIFVTSFGSFCASVKKPPARMILHPNSTSCFSVLQDLRAGARPRSLSWPNSSRSATTPLSGSSSAPSSAGLSARVDQQVTSGLFEFSFCLRVKDC